jgi:hypothetical protein
MEHVGKPRNGPIGARFMVLCPPSAFALSKKCTLAMASMRARKHKCLSLEALSIVCAGAAAACMCAPAREICVCCAGWGRVGLGQKYVPPVLYRHSTTTATTLNHGRWFWGTVRTAPHGTLPARAPYTHITTMGNPRRRVCLCAPICVDGTLSRTSSGRVDSVWCACQKYEWPVWIMTRIGHIRDTRPLCWAVLAF